MPTRLTKLAVNALRPADAPYEVRDDDVTGLLIRVEPGGTRSWFYSYRVAGRRNRLRLGVYPNVSPEGARTLAKQAAADVSRGIDPQAKRKAERLAVEREKVATLRAFLADRYEPWAKAHLKSADFQLERLRSDFATWLDRPLRELDKAAVERLRQEWRAAGHSAKSTNRDVQRLQSVLSRAVEWGLLDRHPMTGLKPLKTDRSGRVRYLTAEEERALVAALDAREARLRGARESGNRWREARGRPLLPALDGAYGDALKPLTLTALHTGLRRGELLGLRWSEVDLKGGVLTVLGTSAKTGQTRRVPLNATILGVLEAWRKQHPDEVLVFGRAGERVQRIDRSWTALVEAAGLVDFHFHDCRHHFASKLVMADVPLNTVRELLGHTTIEMTLRYAHLAPGNLKAAVAKIA